MRTPVNLQAARTEIKLRYEWDARRRRKERDPKPPLLKIRFREIERVLKYRYGDMLPDDDAGRDDIEIVANHIAFMPGDPVANICKWVRMRAPWMPRAELQSLAERVAEEPRRFTADVLGCRLGLSYGERMDLGITTIGAFDVPKAMREVLRKQKRRQAERERRRRKAEAQGRTLRPKPGRPRK